MDNAARFGGSQSARNSLDNFQRERKRQWTFPPDFGLECFAFDQLHHIEAFAVLFAVMTDPRDVWMMNLRGGAGFTQETRSDSGHLRDPSVDYLQSNDRIQYCVARAISYRHCSGAELDWKTVRADFHFKVIVLQRPRYQSSAVLDFVRLLATA